MAQAAKCEAEAAKAASDCMARLRSDPERVAKCEKEGIAKGDACESEGPARVVGAPLYVRCDSAADGYCWAVVHTNKDWENRAERKKADRCAFWKVSRGSALPPDGVEITALGACPEEVRYDFIDRHLRPNPPDSTPPLDRVATIKEVSCTPAGEKDTPRWRDGYCYGVFKEFGRDLYRCGEVKRDLDKSNRYNYRIFSIEDCPSSVFHAAGDYRRDCEDLSPYTSCATPILLSPIFPTGVSVNPASTITTRDGSAKSGPGDGSLKSASPAPSNPASSSLKSSAPSPTPATKSPGPPMGSAAVRDSTVTGDPPGGLRLDVKPKGASGDLNDVSKDALKLLRGHGS